MADLFHVDRDSWLAEADLTAEYFTKFGDKVPAALTTQLADIKTRLAVLTAGPPARLEAALDRPLGTIKGSFV